MIPLRRAGRPPGASSRLMVAAAALCAAVALVGCTPRATAETPEEEAAAQEIGTVEQAPGSEGGQQVEDGLMVGELSFDDVDVRDDGLGDFMVAAKVTNRGTETRGCLLTAYIFSGGSVVGTATGTVLDLGPGETRDATFRGVDAYSADWDAVTFQVDAEF
jgi:hypothetical protein